MKIASVLGILVIAILITLYEWPKINKSERKEKRAFVLLTISGIMLAVLLVYFPYMPGPSQLVEHTFHPLGRILEK